MAFKSVLNAAANAVPFGAAVLSALDKLDAFGKPSSGIESFDGFIKTHSLKSSSATRWNKIYPYTLRFGPYSKQQFLKAVKSYGKTDTESKGGSPSLLTKAASAINKVISDTPPDNIPFSVVLPISPSQIEVRTPMASTTQVSLNGIIEQHNGSPLRFITIRGTTGIAPGRPLFNGVGQSISVDESSEDQSTSAVAALTNAGLNTIGGIFSARQTSLNKNRQLDELADLSLFSNPLTVATPVNVTLNNLIYTTGYWKFHQLVTFFDIYSNIKKLNTGSKNATDDLSQLYVVFEMEKDELYYQSTVKNFSWSKRAGTMEYDYVIELVAWGYEPRQEGLGSQIGSLINKVTGISNGIAALGQAKSLFSKR